MKGIFAEDKYSASILHRECKHVLQLFKYTNCSNFLLVLLSIHGGTT